MDIDSYLGDRSKNICEYSPNSMGCSMCNECVSCDNLLKCYNCNHSVFIKCSTFCNHCEYSSYLYNCRFCYACDWCMGLSFTKNNIFCYGNEELWNIFPEYRIFNIQVTKKEFESIELPDVYFATRYDHINDKDKYKKIVWDMWNRIDNNTKEKFFNLPHFNRDVFTHITWIYKDSEDNSYKSTVI